jgi:hypothetical protein
MQLIRRNFRLIRRKRVNRHAVCITHNVELTYHPAPALHQFLLLFISYMQLPRRKYGTINSVLFAFEFQQVDEETATLPSDW